MMIATKATKNILVHNGQPILASGSCNSQILAKRTGLVLPGGLPYETWEETGRKIVRLHDAFAWCVGDWLVYGQNRYPDRYQRALQSLGLDYQTLRNYAWVARRFPLERRREVLSFQHHTETAALSVAEQDIWLDRCVEYGWSRNVLRKNLKESRKPVPRPPNLCLAALAVSDERIRNWQEAAQNIGCSFEHWLLRALDCAAEQNLDGGRAAADTRRRRSGA